MSRGYQHIIISRVNLHMDLCPWKYDDHQMYKNELWDPNRFFLLNDIARPSLKRQSSQNFAYVTLWQNGHVIREGMLENETAIEIERTGTRDDGPLDYEAISQGRPGKNTLNYSDQIRDKIKERFDPPLLVTGLDIDDCLHRRFVEILQRAVDTHKFNRDEFYYFNTATRYLLNLKTGDVGQKNVKGPHPFVSTWEPEVLAYPVRYNHSLLAKSVEKGTKVKGLYGLQTIHDKNIYSRSVGERADFNLEDFLWI